MISGASSTHGMATRLLLYYYCHPPAIKVGSDDSPVRTLLFDSAAFNPPGVFPGFPKSCSAALLRRETPRTSDDHAVVLTTVCDDDTPSRCRE